jgi:acyl carrier protein
VDPENQLNVAFRTSLGLGDEADLRAAAYGNPEEWDSVAHMQLVAAIESAFQIMIETEDVIAMSDYNVTREILRTKYAVPIGP